MLGTWAGAIAWSDWRWHRIPNAALLLLLVPALLALAVNGKGLLGVAAGSSVCGLLLAAALLPGYALGHMGAGDVKFAGCLGLLLGFQAAAYMLLTAGVLLGAASAAQLWWERQHPGNPRRRIATAPLLTLGFIVQLPPVAQWLSWKVTT